MQGGCEVVVNLEVFQEFYALVVRGGRGWEGGRSVEGCGGRRWILPW